MAGSYRTLFALVQFVAASFADIQSSEAPVPGTTDLWCRVEERSPVPLDEERLGRIGLDEWLRRSQARA